MTVPPVLTARLNVLDELYLHLDRAEEAWSVHVELRVEGRIDAERLAVAVRAAARRHPIARARLGAARALEVRYRWEIADELGELDLLEVHDDLEGARERLLGRTPSLDRPGPFSLLLAHQGAGDVVVLNLHHAAGDGLSALRLLGSIARAYAGDDDPPAPVDPLAVRDIGALTGPGSVRERLLRGRAALDLLGRGLSVPARIAPEGDSVRAGYGFEQAAFGPDELARVLALRSDGATVNDVLLAALAVTVHRWNEERDAPGGAVYLMMPVNLRPPAWRSDVVGNFASYVSVRLGADDHGSLAAAVPAAAASTRRVKDGGLAGLIVDLVDLPGRLPTGVKQRLQDLIPLTGDVVVDTAVLSNLGRIDAVPHLGDAGAVREVWFSPPGRMPLGASLGAATLDGRLFLCLRHRHALFDAAAARAFLATFRRVLDGA